MLDRFMPLEESRVSDADPDQLPLLDEEIIAELREVMEDEFADLLQDFLSDLPLQLNRLQTAIAQGDGDGLYHTAHKFKSSCGCLGAARLMELIQRLELAGRRNTLDDAAELLRHARTVAAATVAGLHARLD